MRQEGGSGAPRRAAALRAGGDEAIWVPKREVSRLGALSILGVRDCFAAFAMICSRAGIRGPGQWGAGLGVFNVVSIAADFGKWSIKEFA
jgi:hypothetical protein